MTPGRIAVAVLLMFAGATVFAEDINLDDWDVHTRWRDWGLEFDSPNGWVEPGGWKPQYRWWWWHAGTAVVLEYQTYPIRPADKGIAITVLGYPEGSDYRAQRIWWSMAAVMEMAGCREQLDDLSWGLDRVHREVVTVHQGRCGGRRGYSLSLEVDRSLWVLTVEHHRGCCEDFDRVRSLVDEPTDGEYRMLRTAFHGL